MAAASSACGATSWNNSSRSPKVFLIDCNNHKCNSVQSAEFVTDLDFIFGLDVFSINSEQFFFNSMADSCWIRVFECENMLSNSCNISIALPTGRKLDSDGIITGNLFICMKELRIKTEKREEKEN